MGIEPMLGQHLWHTGYKSVGASNYTNLPFKMVTIERLELSRSYEQGILSPLWLPLHHIVRQSGVVGIEPTTLRLTGERNYRCATLQ